MKFRTAIKKINGVWKNTSTNDIISSSAKATGILTRLGKISLQKQTDSNLLKVVLVEGK